MQLADAAKLAFPDAKISVTNLLPQFGSEAKDILIEDLSIGDKKYKVSLHPLPELACFKRMTIVNSEEQKRLSVLYPNGSELLRLNCISSLVDFSVPIIWPTWRNIRPNGRGTFIKSIILQKVSQQ